MILALDIGNTNIEIGIISDILHDFNIIASSRYYTRLDITSDQIAMFVINFLNVHEIKRTQINRIIYSSVVPPLNNLIKKLSEDYFNGRILEVNEKVKIGVDNCYKNPHEVGSDRLVNAAAAYNIYKKNCIIIDLGTATTLCALTDDGKYLGGAIIPGVNTSTRALTEKAARLPAIKIQKKNKLMADNTPSAIESGIYYSVYYALNGMKQKMAEEIGFKDYITIGTGGLSTIFDDTGLFDTIEPLLTLKGLKIILDLNKDI